MNYYKSNFALAQFHKWSVTELEAMIPWERDVYIILLMQHLEEEKQRIKKMEQDQQIKQKSGRKR